MPLGDVIERGHMNRDAVHRMLSQLAQMKKHLFRPGFLSIGSFTCFVDKGKCCRALDRRFGRLMRKDQGISVISGPMRAVYLTIPCFFITAGPSGWL